MNLRSLALEEMAMLRDRCSLQQCLAAWQHEQQENATHLLQHHLRDLEERVIFSRGGDGNILAELDLLSESSESEGAATEWSGDGSGSSSSRSNNRSSPLFWSDAPFAEAWAGRQGRHGIPRATPSQAGAPSSGHFGESHRVSAPAVVIPPAPSSAQSAPYQNTESLLTSALHPVLPKPDLQPPEQLQQIQLPLSHSIGVSLDGYSNTRVLPGLALQLPTTTPVPASVSVLPVPPLREESSVSALLALPLSEEPLKQVRPGNSHSPK